MYFMAISYLLVTLILLFFNRLMLNGLRTVTADFIRPCSGWWFCLCAYSDQYLNQAFNLHSVSGSQWEIRVSQSTHKQRARVLPWVCEPRRSDCAYLMSALPDWLLSLCDLPPHWLCFYVVVRLKEFIHSPIWGSACAVRSFFGLPVPFFRFGSF